MKRRKLYTSFMIIIFCIILSMLTGCSLFQKDEPQHTHTYSNEWVSNATYHWQACNGCDEVRYKEEHDWDVGVVSVEPTETTEGVRTYTCGTCGKTKQEKIDKLSHTHTYSNEWSGDDNYHWHQATCSHTNEFIDKSEHQWSEGVVVKEASETEEGIKRYTCTVCGKTKDETIEKLAHVHTFSSEWTSDDNYHWHQATCSHTNEVSDKSEHSWDNGTIVKEASEAEEGIKRYTCTICKQTKDEKIDKLDHTHTYETGWTSDANYHWHKSTCGHDVITGKAEHNWDEGIITLEPTTSSEGLKKYTCLTCGATKEEVISIHVHTFASDWTSDENYHWHAASCGHNDQISDKAEHNWVSTGTITTSATETVEGEEEQRCSICGATRVVKTGLLGHEHEFYTTWSTNEESHWHEAACSHTYLQTDKENHLWDDGELISEVSLYEDGLIIYVCTVCGYEKEVREAKYPSFTVSFVDKYGRTISSNNYAIGSNLTDIIIPNADDLEGFIFDSWQEENNKTIVDNFTFSSLEDEEEVIFNAIYKDAYTITFTDYNNDALKTMKVAKGESISLADCPTIPEREGYTSSWDLTEIGQVNSNLTIKANYNVIKYNVVFKDIDGNILSYIDNEGNEVKNQVIEYGGFAIEPEYNQYYLNRDLLKLYEFTGWNNSFNSVKQDMVITSKYDNVVNEPVILLKVKNNKLYVSIINPNNDIALYNISLMLKWEVPQGICALTNVTVKGTTPLNNGQCGESFCSVSEDKNDWYTFNNKTQTFNILWACGTGHTFNNTYITESVFIIDFELDGEVGMKLSSDSFTIDDSSLIVYGRKNSNIDQLTRNAPFVWIYEEE